MRFLGLLTGLVIGTWIARIIPGARWMGLEYSLAGFFGVPVYLYEAAKIGICLLFLLGCYFLSRKKKKKYILPKF